MLEKLDVLHVLSLMYLVLRLMSNLGESPRVLEASQRQPARTDGSVAHD